MVAATSLAMALPKQPPPKKEEPMNSPQVTLTINAAFADSGWSMTVANTGLVPLRIVADARLLSFEIKGETGVPVKCALPADARPTADIERALFVPPGRGYTERFDPRLYCFGTKEAAALVEGATVVAKYGFAGTGKTPPFIVSPPDVDTAKYGDAIAWPSPVKEIQSAELTLPKRPVPITPITPAENTARFRVSMTQRMDSSNAFDATVTVTIHNEGIRPETLLFLPSTVAFDIQSPLGKSVRCSLGLAPTAVRDLLTTVGAGHDSSISVAADRMCPTGTFDTEGLYRMTPILDTRRVLAGPGLTLATGEWRGDAAIFRIRQGKTPRPKPELDPDIKK
jgi:hypothetical protein